jgi:hypothetical protein
MDSAQVAPSPQVSKGTESYDPPDGPPPSYEHAVSLEEDEREVFKEEGLSEEQIKQECAAIESNLEWIPSRPSSSRAAEASRIHLEVCRSPHITFHRNILCLCDIQTKIYPRNLSQFLVSP